MKLMVQPGNVLVLGNVHWRVKKVEYSVMFH